MKKFRASSIESLAIFGCAIVFVIWSLYFIYRSSFVAIDGQRYFALFDDAMISMRYAWNFAHGLGLVWNPGEFVEGYTNLLMTLLMSLPMLFFSKSISVLVIQLLGIVFVLGSGFVTMRIYDLAFPETPHARLGRILSFVCVLFYYPLAYWSLMGMETGLLTFLLLMSILCALRYAREQHFSQLAFMSISLGLAYLTRNDSAIFAVLIFAYVGSAAYKSKTLTRIYRQVGGALCIFGLFVIGHALFRVTYYGDLLPNTYYLKLTGLPLAFRIRDGAAFVQPFLLQTAIIIVVVFLDIALRFRWTKLFLSSFIVAALSYQVRVGGDPWLYWRIMAPAMPLTLALFVQAALNFVESISRRFTYADLGKKTPFSYRQWAKAIVVVCLTLLALLSVDRVFRYEILFRHKPYQVADNETMVNTAIALEQLTTKDASVGVVWAGAIPYYSGRVAVDFLGKSDKYIARLEADSSGSVAGHGMKSVPGHNKYDLNYSIKQLKPTYIQLTSYGRQDISEWTRSVYQPVIFKGLTLLLLKNSPDVDWEKIAQQGSSRRQWHAKYHKGTVKQGRIRRRG